MSLKSSCLATKTCHCVVLCDMLCVCVHMCVMSMCVCLTIYHIFFHTMVSFCSVNMCTGSTKLHKISLKLLVLRRQTQNQLWTNF